MPEVSSKTPADRALANATNMRSRLNGDMELEPSNYFKNWHFNDINEDGDPDCLRIGMPEVPDGWAVYVSEAGGGPSTLAAQNDEPIPLHAVSYISSESWVGGKAPVTKAFAAEIAPPDVPGYEIINATRGGFEAGLWYLAYTWNDDWYRQTISSPAASVTLSQGQGIRVKLPSSVPEGAKGINFYMGRDPSVLNRQRHFSLRSTHPESVLLTGPFVKDIPPPPQNDTSRFNPRQPGISFISSNTTLQPGSYTVRSVAVDATGESAPSADTRTVTVDAPMPNTSLAVELGYVEDNCVFDDDDPSDFVDASIRHRVFVTKDGSEYLAYDPTRGSQQRTLSARDALTLSGYTQDNVPTGVSMSYILGRGTAPTPSSKNNNQGLEAPTTPLDSLTPEGLAVLTPGTYWIAVSYTVRGKESMVSTPIQVTLPSAKMLRVIFPDTVNVIPDPNVYERDASGIPLSHVLTSGAGSATTSPTDGTIILDTLGNITTATQTAPSHYVDFSINRGFTYQIGATEGITALSAGTFVEELAEYDEFSNLLATTTLLSISGTGTARPLSKFGPGATTNWQPATVTARLIHRFNGVTVNGKVSLSEFKALPTDSNYRKTIFPPKFIREPGQPDVPPQTPHPRFAQKYVGRPPSSLRNEPPPSQVIDATDFETGSLPGSWTLTNTNTTACQQSVVSSAAIGGSFGWQVKKTTSATGYVYMERTFTPSTRKTLAVRAKYRIRKLPPSGITVPLFVVRPQSTTAGNLFPRLAMVYLQGNQVNYLGGTIGNVETAYTAGSCVVGDVLDMELILEKTDNGGNINFALGKNTSTRVFQGWKGQFNWTGVYPTTIDIGMPSLYYPYVTVEYDVDDITITDAGDSLGSGLGTPVLQPLGVPDRPIGTAVTVEGEYDFETGTIPAAFTQTRTPADSTTTLTAQAASAINGSFGVRAADTGTATTANVYIQRQLSASRTSLGARARYRIVARPSAGEVQMLGLLNSAGTLLGAITLDSTGVLYCRPYSGGVAGTSVPIATGVVNTNVLHLDLVAQFTGTTGGLLSAWVKIGGTGSAAERQLMFQKTNLNWSAGQVGNARFGGFNEASALNTWSFDIDSILLTDVGETVFSENWNQGVIHQVHVFLPPGTPISDKWLLRGYREAVLPGLQYTAAIKARFSGIRDTPNDVSYTAYPCYFTAYDVEGNPYPLGSIVGDSGVSGTLGWADYQRTFTIPSDCYEVRMDSRQIGEGEYAFQEFAFCKGTTVTREVSYPTGGSAGLTLDTMGAVPNGSWVSLGRKWQEVGAILDTPPGTGGSVTYYSREADGDALSGPASDPTLLVQGRFADFAVALTGDGVSSSRLKRGSPYIRYAITSGPSQIATLLRYDRSEFSGGAIVTELGVPYLRTQHGVNVLPSGRIARQRIGDPIGLLPDCIIGVFTEDAAREIQERALDDDFYIETRDKLYRVRFSEEIVFDPPIESSLAKYEGEWRMWAEAETGDAEILELVDYTIS